MNLLLIKVAFVVVAVVACALKIPSPGKATIPTLSERVSPIVVRLWFCIA